MPDADCHPRSYRTDCDADLHSFLYPHSYRHADPWADLHSYQYPHRHPYPRPFSHAAPILNANFHSYQDLYPNAYFDTLSITNVYSLPCSHPRSLALALRAFLPLGRVQRAV
ncbi:MAG: hypothetical protein ACP5N6_15370, partial [Anaerolineae bacterium]